MEINMVITLMGIDNIIHSSKTMPKNYILPYIYIRNSRYYYLKKSNTEINIYEEMDPFYISSWVDDSHE